MFLGVAVEDKHLNGGAGHARAAICGTVTMLPLRALESIVC